MACESFVEHVVGSLYFLQQKLFLRFSQILMLLVILRAEFLPAEAGYFSTRHSQIDGNFLVIQKYLYS